MRWTELSWGTASWTELRDRREQKCWMERKTNEGMNRTELRLAEFNWSEDNKWNKENWVELKWIKTKSTTELSWIEMNKRQEDSWNKVPDSVNVTASGASSMIWCYSVSRPSGVDVMVLEQTASTLSFFLFDYSWPWQAMEVCIDKYFVSGILRRARDLETRRPWHVCVLIKGVWPQNALSVFICVHVLIRAVCSQCALVFSVLWLNNISDVIQGQMRGGESELDGRRKKNRDR